MNPLGLRGAPALCFHGIGTPRRELEVGEAAYWVSEDVFASVLDLVVDEPHVRLSFDDGNVSDVEVALPALLERGLSATFFVLAGRLDRPGSLSGPDVRALAAAGMTVGTHGMDHRPWRGLDDAAAQRELVEARDVLTEVSGRPVQHAALPLGRYDRRVLGRLRALGYRTVSSSDRAWSSDGAWLQSRSSVHRGDTAASVRARALTAPSAPRRLRTGAVGTLKRLR